MIEVLKQALEALETYRGYMEPLTTVFGGPRVPAEQSTTGKVERAITSLRQAIAEAEKQSHPMMNMPHDQMVAMAYGYPPQRTEQEPVQEPEYRCCPHDSDCAVHNMPAYPAGPCDCSYSNTFNLPSSSLVHEVCLKLAKRELEKLTNENFGRTPNDTWTNKIVDVYDFFDNNSRAKKLTEIYTTHPLQRIEQNFCPRCGKRTHDIHTCTPPQDSA